MAVAGGPTVEVATVGGAAWPPEMGGNEGEP